MARFTCVFTVPSLSTRCSAISALVAPVAMSRSTASSRWVRPDSWTGIPEPGGGTRM